MHSEQGIFEDEKDKYINNISKRICTQKYKYQRIEKEIIECQQLKLNINLK